MQDFMITKGQNIAALVKIPVHISASLQLNINNKIKQELPKTEYK